MHPPKRQKMPNVPRWRLRVQAHMRTEISAPSSVEEGLGRMSNCWGENVSEVTAYTY